MATDLSLRVLQINRDNANTIIVVEVSSTAGGSVVDAYISITVGDAVIQRGPLKIAPSQTHSEVVPVGRSAEPALVVLRYATNGIENTKTAVGSMPSVSPSSSFNAYFTSILGVVGVALGAVLAHFFSKNREGARSHFEWRKMLYEHREPWYLEFLTSWDLSTSAQVFERRFNELRNKAYVPADVVSSAQRLMENLRDPNLSASDKTDAAKTFYAAISKFALSPEIW